MLEENIKIIKSVRAKKNSDSCYVEFMDGESILLNIDIVASNYLKKNMQIDQVLLESMLKAQKSIDAKKIAYRVATYKPRSEKQIRDKMREKRCEPDDIEFGIKFLNSFGLIDDYKFASLFITNKVKTKFMGRSRLILELKSRGVREDIINRAMAENFPENDTIDIAFEAASKKFRTLSAKPVEKQKSSLTSYLARQGYSWDIIKKVLSRLFE
jgi:regulatory protein